MRDFRESDFCHFIKAGFDKMREGVPVSGEGR